MGFRCHVEVGSNSLQFHIEQNVATTMTALYQHLSADFCFLIPFVSIYF